MKRIRKIRWVAGLLVILAGAFTAIAIQAPNASAAIEWNVCYASGGLNQCTPHTVWSDRSPTWAVPDSSSYRLTFQPDCNLVFYDPGYPNNVSWATGTHSAKRCSLVWQSDGNVVIYNYQGLAGWASGTNYGTSYGYTMYMNDIGQLWIDRGATHVWCNHPGACTYQ